MRKAAQEITCSEADEMVMAQMKHQINTNTRHNIQGHIVAFSAKSANVF